MTEIAAHPTLTKVDSEDINGAIDEGRWDSEGGHPDHHKLRNTGGIATDKLDSITADSVINDLNKNDSHLHSLSKEENVYSPNKEAGRWESEGGSTHPQSVKEEESAEKGIQSESAKSVSSSDKIPGNADVSGSRKLSWSERAKETWQHTKERAAGLFSKPK